MVMQVLIAVALIALTYYGYRVGVFDATVLLLASLFASILTITFLDSVRQGLVLRFFTKKPWAATGVSFWLLFVPLFLITRQTVDHLLRDERFALNSMFYKAGGVAMGFLAAFFLVGAITVGWYTLPLSRFTPPRSENQDLLLNVDKAFLRTVGLVSRRMGPSDRAKQFGERQIAELLAFKTRALEESQKKEITPFIRINPDGSPEIVDKEGRPVFRELTMEERWRLAGVPSDAQK